VVVRLWVFGGGLVGGAYLDIELGKGHVPPVCDADKESAGVQSR
jgi:hypothetical protein